MIKAVRGARGPLCDTPCAAAHLKFKLKDVILTG